METTNIYYGKGLLTGHYGLLEPELEPVAKSIKSVKTDISHVIMNCPVFMNSMRGMYVLKSPCDLHVHRDKDGYLDASFPTGWSAQEPAPLSDASKSKDVLQLLSGFLFAVADKPCTVDVYPPFYHSNKFFGFAGTFDIHSWYRCIHLATIFPYDELLIKEGEPIMYVKFTPKKGKVKLHKSIIPPEAAHYLNAPMDNKGVMSDKPMSHLYKLMNASRYNKKLVQIIKEHNKNL